VKDRSPEDKSKVIRGGIVRLLGIGLILLPLADIFLTVLYPRSGKGRLSMVISKWIWRLFRLIANLPFWRFFGRASGSNAPILSYCGPVLLVVIVFTWIVLQIVGFACIYWTELGSELQSSDGGTPFNFVTALYYSGYVYTTLGVGDLIPQTSYLRLLTIVEASLGFSIFTLTITYLLAVYSALNQRNVFALSLHHRTLSKGDAAELIARMGAGNDFSDARTDIGDIARNLLTLLESHHAYPIVHYFHFQASSYSLARIIWLSMDTVTLIETALHPQKYRALINSTVVAELADGGQHLLTELSLSFLPRRSLSKCRQPEETLRQRYYQAIERLRQENIETVTDIEAGADHYIAVRRCWEPYAMGIASYMGYRWSDVAPSESKLVREMGRAFSSSAMKY
jgi:hypothetical protein